MNGPRQDPDLVEDLIKGSLKPKLTAANVPNGQESRPVRAISGVTLVNAILPGN